MIVSRLDITVNDIVLFNKQTGNCDGFINEGEEGVFGMNYKLNIRPKFQREFIYDQDGIEKVIETVRNGHPLGIIYFIKTQEENYEILDGQQRILSLCKYIEGDSDISAEWPGRGRVYFDNLSDEEIDKLLNYPLLVHICEGSDKEILDWFFTINIAGKQLTPQEGRNAIFAGPWVSDARMYFSKINCPAVLLDDNKYMKGSAKRQDYLETVIKWISEDKISEDKIHDYMASHHHNQDAKDLWEYFNQVMNWVENIFTTYRKEMKGIDWGYLYNKYKNNVYTPSEVEREIKHLMEDDEVSSKKGIYLYFFDRDEKHLNIRLFSDKQKREAYERQGGICVHCKEHFQEDDMEADHITPWVEGGRTNSENCQMLCKKCNREKGQR